MSYSAVFVFLPDFDEDENIEFTIEGDVEVREIAAELPENCFTQSQDKGQGDRQMKGPTRSTCECVGEGLKPVVWCTLRGKLAASKIEQLC